MLLCRISRSQFLKEKTKRLISIMACMVACISSIPPFPCSNISKLLRNKRNGCRTGSSINGFKTWLIEMFHHHIMKKSILKIRRAFVVHKKMKKKNASTGNPNILAAKTHELQVVETSIGKNQHRKYQEKNELET